MRSLIWTFLKGLLIVYILLVIVQIAKEVDRSGFDPEGFILVIWAGIALIVRAYRRADQIDIISKGVEKARRRARR